MKQILVDDGKVHQQVISDKKFDKVLELVGTTSLRDSLEMHGAFWDNLHDWYCW